MIVIFDIQFVTSCNMVNDDTLYYEKHIYMYCEDLICNSIFRPIHLNLGKYRYLQQGWCRWSFITDLIFWQHKYYLFSSLHRFKWIYKSNNSNWLDLRRSFHGLYFGSFRLSQISISLKRSMTLLSRTPSVSKDDHMIGNTIGLIPISMK